MSLHPRSSLVHPVSVIETAAEEANRKLREAKRLKQKLSRIAPIPNPTDSSDGKQEIDDEVLERCTRCPPHRKRRGVFRPLIGNDGEFLCDSCYQKEFPATAFLEETNKSSWQRRGSNIADKIRNGASDMVADVFGKTKLPGHEDDRSNIDFPSEVECRMCLDKGIFRRCCSSYYCHPCYYQRKSCPGCEQEVPLTGIAAKREDHPGKLAVRLSWAVSTLITALTLIILFMYYWNEVTSPMTVMGHSCRGFFPRCELTVCIDFDGGYGYGEGGSWMPAAEPYRICNRETTTNQVVASACIYDNEMYAWSNKLIGYDLCTSSSREEHSKQNDVSSVNPLLLYAESAGVYVFDDDFEIPLRLASAPWHEIINGDYSDACGVNSASPARGNHGGYQPVENRNALVFTGVHTRHATTEGIAVPYGGAVEFYLKMGPLSNDPYAKCKSAYDGDVALEFCFNNDECTEIMLLKTWKYRGESFHFLSIEIPEKAYTNHTRFRFRQLSFDASRDHWAIDDVRIRANLHPGWRESSAFSERKKVSGIDIQQAACCYGSDKCSIFDQKDTNYLKCESIPEFNRNEQISRMKSSELYILFSLLAVFAKIAYHRVYDHYVSLSRSETTFKSAQPGAASDQFPNMMFHAVTQLTWQYTIASIFGILLVGVLLRFFWSLDLARCFTGEACYIDGSSVFVFGMAMGLDLRVIKTILCRVLVIERPVEFLVDLHPDNSLMQIEGKNIPLGDVTAMNRKNAGFMWIMSICYVVGGFPFALGSLTLRSYHLHGSSEILYTIFGLASLFREMFGVAFIAKFFLSTQWIFAFGQDDREDFGRALKRKGLMQQFVIGASLTSIIVMIAIFARRVDNLNAWDGLIAFASCIVFGGLIGVLVGIMQGLPVVPEAYLTCWPSACYCISYNDRAHCPCLFSCTSCGDMNSRRVMLILTVEEMFALKKILSGTTT